MSTYADASQVIVKQDLEIARLRENNADLCGQIDLLVRKKNQSEAETERLEKLNAELLAVCEGYLTQHDRILPPSVRPCECGMCAIAKAVIAKAKEPKPPAIPPG